MPFCTKVPQPHSSFLSDKHLQQARERDLSHLNLSNQTRRSPPCIPNKAQESSVRLQRCFSGCENIDSPRATRPGFGHERLPFWLTIQDQPCAAGRRDGCSAGGVTAKAIGCGRWFASVFMILERQEPFSTPAILPALVSPFFSSEQSRRCRASLRLRSSSIPLSRKKPELGTDNPCKSSERGIPGSYRPAASLPFPWDRATRRNAAS